MTSTSPPSMQINLLWRSLCTFWGGLGLGLLVNWVYDDFKQTDILLWIRQNLLIAVPVIILATLFTFTVGAIKYRRSPPAHTIIAWILQRSSAQSRLIIIVLLPIPLAIGSVAVSLSSREAAVTIIPLAVVTLLLLIILLVTEIFSLLPGIFSQKPYLQRLTSSSLAALIVVASLIYHCVQFTQLIPAHQVEITIAYSTEKDGWLQDAIDRYNRQQLNVHVKVVDKRGSLELVDKVLDGSLKPTILSPASTLELQLLYTHWQEKGNEKEIFSQAALKSLVWSPLVLATWKSRAEVLSKSQPSYWPLDWSKVNTLLTKDWSEIGGPSGWYKIKFAQTEPKKSNSGLLTIMLMAHSYPKEQQESLTLDNLNNPQFQEFFQTIENRVSCYAASSRPLEDIAYQYGPSEFDIFPMYENQFLSQEPTHWTYTDNGKEQQSDSLVISYLNLNIISDHPFATLQGAWVTPEQESAAQSFLTFLLAKEQQERALAFGFRPSNLQVLLDANISDNRFLKYPASLKQSLDRRVQTTDGKVIEELLNRWNSLHIEKWCPS
jgi:hypothetical protein